MNIWKRLKNLESLAFWVERNVESTSVVESRVCDTLNKLAKHLTANLTEANRQIKELQMSVAALEVHLGVQKTTLPATEASYLYVTRRLDGEEKTAQ